MYSLEQAEGLSKVADTFLIAIEKKIFRFVQREGEAYFAFFFPKGKANELSTYRFYTRSSIEGHLNQHITSKCIPTNSMEGPHGVI